VRSRTRNTFRSPSSSIAFDTDRPLETPNALPKGPEGRSLKLCCPSGYTRQISAATTTQKSVIDVPAGM
jgi:hypothetical protein